MIRAFIRMDSQEAFGKPLEVHKTPQKGVKEVPKVSEAQNTKYKIAPPGSGDMTLSYANSQFLSFVVDSFK